MNARAAIHREAPGIYTELHSLLKCRSWARSLHLFSRQATRAMLLGETRSRFRGRGMEFEEVRTYQPGDDIRTIDWRVTARTGTPHTKLFCEERERPVHILADQRSPMFFGSGDRFKSVVAAELSMAIAWAALGGSDRIGGQIIGDHAESDIRAHRNTQAVLRFAHDLHEFNHRLPEDAPPNARRPGKGMADMLEECRRITRPGSAIFIIGDFQDFDAFATKALSTLGRHTDITLLHIYDPLEASMPDAGNVAVSDGTRRAIVSLSRSLRDSFLQQREAHLRLVQDAARKSRSLYRMVSTHEDPRQVLLGLYGK